VNWAHLPSFTALHLYKYSKLKTRGWALKIMVHCGISNERYQCVNGLHPVHYHLDVVCMMKRKKTILNRSNSLSWNYSYSLFSDFSNQRSNDNWITEKR
jgi:hypothetical protein